MQLSPQKPFIIVWNGADPNDTDTLYVQAVVRDAKTRTVLSTISLTDRGSHYFDSSYITPHDTSQTQQGRQIIVTLTVYTDAGYTIPSQNYGRETNHYIIQERIDPAKFYGVSGGGYEFDYKAFAKLIEDILVAKIPSLLPVLPVATEAKEFPMAQFISAVKDEIAQIPPYEKGESVDLSNLESGMKMISSKIAALPQPKDMDLKPVLAEIKSMSPELKTLITTLHSSLMSSMQTEMAKHYKDMQKSLTTTIMTEIESNMKAGKFNVSMNFGANGSPEDQTAAKRAAYFKGLKNKLGI